MATFTVIPDTVLEPLKPIRSVDGLALRDNPIAIAEGASGAPRIQNAAMDTDSVDNANVVNGTLGAEKFQSGATERDWVLARTSGAAVGAVGTYAYAETAGGTTVAPGDTTAGSNLDYAGTDDAGGVVGSVVSLTGTWRSMGVANSGDATLFLRIS